MELIADDFGLVVGKHSERIRITKERKVVSQAPLINLEQLTFVGDGIGLSTDVVRICAERGIPLNFVSREGRPIVQLFPFEMTVGMVATRRAQLLAYGDERGVKLAKAFVSGKLHNQAAMLKYLLRNRNDARTQAAVNAIIHEIESISNDVVALTAADVDEARPHLLNLEGRAAQRYWAAVRLVLRDEIVWPGRKRRGAADPLNRALNYGYAILYNQVQSALLRAGLDPYAGFIHADRPGKVSLVYDAIEEFRAPVVDRAVISLFNVGHSLTLDENGYFDLASRRLISRKVFERLYGDEQYAGKRHKLREIILRQAQHIATYLRGKDEYQPYSFHYWELGAEKCSSPCRQSGRFIILLSTMCRATKSAPAWLKYASTMAWSACNIAPSLANYNSLRSEHCLTS